MIVELAEVRGTHSMLTLGRSNVMSAVGYRLSLVGMCDGNISLIAMSKGIAMLSMILVMKFLEHGIMS